MTDVALKEHLEAKIRALEQVMAERLSALRERLDLRVESAEEALRLATRKTESDFAKVNELREQVTEERGMFPRQEKLEALQREVTLLAATLGDRIGRVERFYPIVALASAVLGATGVKLFSKLFGG